MATDAIDQPDSTINVTTEGAVATIVIDAGPVNLFTPTMLVELLRAGRKLAADDALKVVVIESRNPDFFIAHFDVATLLRDPGGSTERPTALNAFGAMCETYRTMPAVTIAKIAGRVGGGGSEFAMACDMRFGELGKAVVNQMEVPLGILPGGGGTQRLTQLVGYARAAELILGGIDLDAATGEQWGYFNRSLPAGEIDDYVASIVNRIASFPLSAVRLAKQSMLAGVPDPQRGLLEESYLFSQLVASPSATNTMATFLEHGGQQPSVERKIAALSGTLSTRDRLVDLLRAELDTYLITASRPEVRTASTRCAPWSGDDVTAHLVATFQRFTAMLQQSRAGDYTAPFGRDDLSAENLAAVANLEGDPLTLLGRAVTEFCELVDDPMELMAHQMGPIPVLVQISFGLSDLVLHHDDLLAAVGERYEPPTKTLFPVVAAWTDVIGFSELEGADDVWSTLLTVSGR